MRYRIILSTSKGTFFYGSEKRRIDKARELVRLAAELPWLVEKDIIYIADIKEIIILKRFDEWLKKCGLSPKRFLKPAPLDKEYRLNLNRGEK